MSKERVFVLYVRRNIYLERYEYSMASLCLCLGTKCLIRFFLSLIAFNSFTEE